MRIKTSRFGEIDVAEDVLLTFPSGLVGLPQFTRYVVLDQECGGYQWLQSVDDGTLAVVVADAQLVKPDYHLQVPPDAVAELGIKDDDPVGLFTILTIPRGKPDRITANLRGPIVANLRNRLAKQMVLHESYPIRYACSQN